MTQEHDQRKPPIRVDRNNKPIERPSTQIVYYDALGQELGREPASTVARVSARGTANHKKMDAFWRRQPSCVRARIDDLEFAFIIGRSRWVGDK